MANEVSVNLVLNINNGSLRDGCVAAFNDDQSEGRGPFPGHVQVPTSGVDVYLGAGLTTPGWAFFRNLDANNYVEWGVKDPQTNIFYPVGELGPGEAALFKLTRNFQEQYSGSGTGTTTPENYLRFKANKTACNVQVKVYGA